MSTFLDGMHCNPDIWVFHNVTAEGPPMTGFQMLTPRAKKWALEYKAPEKPNNVEHMLWVPGNIAGAILNDIANDTNLNVLIDNWEGKMND